MSWCLQQWDCKDFGSDTGIKGKEAEVEEHPSRKSGQKRKSVWGAAPSAGPVSMIPGEGKPVSKGDDSFLVN